MGMCFEGKDDEKLARGWPNVAELVDDGKTDKAAAKAAMKAYGAIDPVHYTVWSRGVLVRLLRATNAALDAKATAYDARQAEMTELAQKAAGDGAPLTAAEAVDALHRMFAKSTEIYPFQTDAFVYGVEAIAGTDAVVDAIAEEIAGAKNKPSNPAIHMAAATGFLLLRASPAAVKRARVALDAALGRVPKKRTSEWGEYADALDLSLHGTAAVRRATASAKWCALDGWRGLIGRPDIEYADDASLVRELVAKAPADASMSVRVAYVGGVATLANLSARKWPARQMPAVVRDFGMIRAPEVVELMLSLVGKSSVKDAPMQWFKDHASYAKPILAKSRSPMAKTVLGQLRA
jgi:hypothetical protein